MGFLITNIMEVWKDLKGYEGVYQVSSFGRVKSLERKAIGKLKSIRLLKEKILTPIIDKGYYIIGLHNNNKQYTKSIHQLVAVAFLNHIPNGHKLVVNHKDFNKLNNHVDNLEIVTNRENCNHKHIKSSSQYTGVYWHKKNKKWMSHISISNKTIYLGSFKTEIEASIKYQNKLKEILS